MKRFFVPVIACFSLFISACNKQEKAANHLAELSAQMDSVRKANPVLTVEHKVGAEEFIAACRDYAKSYPEDSLCAQCLMQSAQLYHAMPSYKQELEVLDNIIAAYPETLYAEQALAAAARVSEDNLRDFESARKYLITMKEKYPNSVYAVNIDLQIEYVGDPEGLLEAVLAGKDTTLGIN